MTTIDPQVETILRQSRVEGTTLFLPGQMDRTLYLAVNDVLERLGGKWNRKAGGHIFRRSPAEALAAVLETGERPDKNPLDFFPTPWPIVSRMLDLAHLGPGQWVLEPSAGEGAIAEGIEARTASYDPPITLHCVELDPGRATLLQRRGYTVYAGSFLEFVTYQQKYDRVLMNPPFTAKADPLAYIAHIERAHGMLARRGRLVSIAPSGFTFRDDRRCREFRRLVQAHGDWCALPAGSFGESGTGVNTVLLWMEA